MPGVLIHEDGPEADRYHAALPTPPPTGESYVSWLSGAHLEAKNARRARFFKSHPRLAVLHAEIRRCVTGCHLALPRHL